LTKPLLSAIIQSERTKEDTKMEDKRIWVWDNRYESWGGQSFDEYVCYETNQIKQVWDDGYEEIFEGESFV
jgi:hypothetical protein